MPEDQNSIIRRLFKSGVLLFVGLVLELGISFLAKVLMARLLGPPTYGVATIGITTLSFASTILLFGMNTGIGRYLPRFDDPADRKGVIESGMQIVLAISVSVAAVLFVFADLVATHVLGAPEATSVLRVAAIGVPFAALMKLSIGVIQGHQRSLPKVLIRNIGQPIVRFGLVVLALYFSLGALGIVGAYAATFAVAGLAGLYYVLTRTNIRSSVSSRTRRRELLTFSAPLMLTASMIMVLSYFDIFILSYFRTSSEVGSYNVVYPLAELLTATLSAFSFIAMPILSELHSERRTNEMDRTYKIVTKWIFMATLPAGLIMILFPAATISLTFGPEYTEAALPLVVLAVGFFTHAVAGPNVNTLTAIGRTRTIMWDNLLAGGTNIVLNVVLIPEYGLMGAAVATAVSYIGLNTLYSVQLYRATGIHPATAALFKPATVGVFSMLGMYVIVTRVLTVTGPVLLGIAVVFITVYGVAILALGGIEEEEVMLVLSFEERFGVNLGPVKRIAGHFIDQ
ncbi:flippase [Natribaculum luteum]|uniref:Flippase n=1 Tax=Natribaculum luteum TaxID=1586232 RepID=A0ABD5NU80_9EURY|nr:flippase [Natribaculum luteum]